MSEPISARVRVLGVFYRGMDTPLMFSVNVEGHPEVVYAEIPTKDAEFRQMAIDVGKPLKQWCLEWNDIQIELDRERTAELVKRGLAFTATSNSIDSGLFKAFDDHSKAFFEEFGIDMKPD